MLERLASNKHSNLSGLFLSYEESKVLWKWPQELYSQYFVSFVTDESTQLAIVLHKTMLERLASNKHSNLSGLFISYEESKVLWKRPQGLYSQHFVFFVTYESAQLARVSHKTMQERLASNKHSSLSLHS